MCDKLVTNIKTKLDILNKLFAEQCTHLWNDSAFLTSQRFLTQWRLHSLDFSLDEIPKIITSLDVNKVLCHCDISIRMIKIYSNSLVSPVSLLFEKYFDNFFFFSWIMENSKYYTSSLKKNDKKFFQNITSFHISLLPVLSKIFEKIIFNKAYIFFPNK